MTREWFVYRNGKQHGPIPQSKLKDIATTGKITPEDLVWCEGLDDWTPAGRIKDLFRKLAPVPPPLLPRLPANIPPTAAGSQTPPESDRLSDCPDCGNSVSKRAEACPKCGCPISGKAVEARLTIFRVNVEAKSLRRTAIHLDGNFIADLNNSDGTTVVIEPGKHTVSFSAYSILSGELSCFKKLQITIGQAEHMILEFTPYGGIFGSEFQSNISQKLD